MPEYSIIIPTVLTNSEIEKNISCIIDLFSEYKFEVILVNDSKTLNPQLNFSSDKLILLDNPGAGAASARNYGAKQAKHDTLIFIDDDIVLQKPGFIEFLKELDEKLPESLVLPNWIYPTELINQCEATSFGRFLIKIRNNSLAGYMNLPEFKTKELIPHTGIASYFLCINKAVFFEIGAYNESIPFAGFEDHDLSAKLNNRGVKIYIDPTYTVWHNEHNKLNLSVWLNRKRNGAVTRRKAFDLGYKELELEFNNSKVLIFNMVYPFESLLQRLVVFIGSLRVLDFLSFTVLKYLVASNIYRGYNLKS